MKLKMIYNPTKNVCKENSHLTRIGLTGFEETQIDTLSFIPLSDKVISILTGNPNFTAEELESDYDEPESDDWENTKDDIEVYPIDEYSDKVDVIEVKKANNEKIEEAKKKIVQRTVIDESKDSNNSSTESNASNSTTEEK